MNYTNIIGRREEISKLERLYNSGKSEFIAIYGRRRIGKSFLVNEVFGVPVTSASPSPYIPTRQRTTLALPFPVKLQNNDSYVTIYAYYTSSLEHMHSSQPCQHGAGNVVGRGSHLHPSCAHPNHHCC